MSSVMQTVTDPAASGGRLVATGGRVLPLTGTRLRSDARGGLARTTVEQNFRNTYNEPLAVTYMVPLPAEAAVSGFEFTIGDRRVAGRIEGRESARDEFEKAIAEGRTAAILDSERDTVFSQEIGNIPAGAEVIARIIVDHALVWLAGGEWEWRFPTVVAPKYMGAEGRVPDAKRVSVEVSDQPLAVRGELALRVRDELGAPGAVPVSPSHAIRSDAAGDGLEVSGRDLSLDRDLVVRWPVAGREPGLTLDTGRPDAKTGENAAFDLLTIVPPVEEEGERCLARDLIALMDTSGSMSGEPLEAARDIVAGLVESLGDRDTLELIAFASTPERWKEEPVRATEEAKAAALGWLGARRAGGGTEMLAGVREALAGVRPGSVRQVILVTDGQVGFEREIVASVLKELPAGSRLHTVGVGPAVNRDLIAARAGRGTEVIAGGRGDEVARALRRILAATRHPLLADVVVEGFALVESAPARIPDLLGAGPTFAAVKLDPRGGELFVHGRTATGDWSARIEVPPVARGSGNAAVAALFAREKVRDLETSLAGGGDTEARLRAKIEAIGLSFGIATRWTSWVAVSEEPGVDPTQPFRREVMPHNLPAGLSAEGLGIRPAGGAMMVAQREPLAAWGPVADISASIRSGFYLQDSGWRDIGIRRPLRGRIVRYSGRSLVVEVSVDRGLDWNPVHVEVFWDEIARADARLLDHGSTKPGRLSAGMTLRLSLELPDGLEIHARPMRLEVHGSGAPLVIELEDR